MDEARNPMTRLVSRAWDQAKTPLYRNAFFIMLTGVITNGLGFLFWFLVAHEYKDADIGAAVTLFQVLGFLGTLANLGLGIGLIRYMPEAEDKTALLNISLTLTAFVSLLLGLVFLVGLPVWIPDLSFVLQEPLYILTILVCTVVLGLSVVLDYASIAIRRAEVQTWRNAVFSILKIPLAIGLVYFLPGRAGVFLAMAFAVGVSVVITGIVHLPRTIPDYRPRPALRLDPIRPVLRFSLGNYAAATIAAAGYLLPAPLIFAVLGSNAGAVNAAYFYVALIVASLLYFIPTATFTSLLAESSQENADRRHDERHAILLSIALLVPGIVFMWIFSAPLLQLFGPGFASRAVTPLRILAIGSVPVFLSGIYTTRVRVQKRTRPLIVSAAITTGITLGLGWFLLHDAGLRIDGLAYAYLVGQAAAIPYLIYEARNASKTRPSEPNPGQGLS